MGETIDFDKEIAETKRQSGFRSLIGYKTIEWRQGYSEILLRLDDKHMNIRMNPHGGLYVVVIDSAMGHAATFCPVANHQRICVTTSLQSNFLAPAKDYMRVCATLVGVDGRIATCRAEVTDSHGTLCNVAQGSFLYMPGSEKLDGVPVKDDA